MSKIDELIQELCPGGVPGRQLGEFLVEQRTRAGAASNHPVFGISNSDGFLPSEEMFAKSRASQDISNYKVVSPNDFAYNPSRINVGSIARQSHPTAVLVSPMYIAFSLSKSLDVRYFEYFLSSSAFKSQMLSGIEVGARFRFTFESLSEVVIQAPPIEVQKEIVAILDKFTRLEAELEAELEARRTQYEVTRERLLDFTSELEAHPLRAMIRELSPYGISVVPISRLTTRVKSVNWKEAEGAEFSYLDLASIDLQTKRIGELKTVDQNSAPSRARQLVQAGDVLFATTRPLQLRTYLVPTGPYFIASTGYCVLRMTGEDLMPQFLKHVLNTREFAKFIEQNQSTGNYPSVSDSIVKSYGLPLPPLEMQKEIVSILDKLDDLVNDITIGLPAEIAARRKQYEYYRNRLLSFKELDAA
jgi:type I restriction enzyme S subunit